MEAYDDIMDEFTDALAPVPAEELNAYFAAWEGEGDNRFTPETDEQFEWAMRKRSRLLRKAQDLTAARDHELDLLRRAFDKRIATEQHAADFFADMIVRGVTERGEKVGTVAGTAYPRAAERFDWPEDSALVTWCRANGHDDLVRVKESPDKTGLKKLVKECGEAIDGLTITKPVTVVIKEA